MPRSVDYSSKISSGNIKITFPKRNKKFKINDK